MGKFSKDKRDIFYRLAKSSGYRARSAYKLLHLDATFDLLGGVSRAVDLCAAPGSWSQVLGGVVYEEGEERIEGKEKVVAIDLQKMSPIEGVKIMQGDITSPATATRVIDHFEGNLVDIVISDGAPDVTGLHDIDEYVQGQLVLSAVNITTKILRPGGSFVAKIFRGRDISLLIGQMRLLFSDVCVAKPVSSRNSSVEGFVVCRGFGGCRVELEGGFGGGGAGGLKGGTGLDDDGEEATVKFVRCGDLNSSTRHKLQTTGVGVDVAYLDSDKSYPIDTRRDEAVPIVEKPIMPPYEKFKEMYRQKK